MGTKFALIGATTLSNSPTLLRYNSSLQFEFFVSLQIREWLLSSEPDSR
jgi:hypothetical protein